MKKRVTGFTLIELLVVIAIIAILAAILFPVFAQAREQAKKSKCSASLRQIGLGLITYSQDYNETMPPSLGYDDQHVLGLDFPWRGKTRKLTWDMAIVKYVREAADIFKCPSDGLTDPARRDWGFRSYSMNDIWWAYYHVRGTPSEQRICRGISLSAVPRSSQYVIINEWPDVNNRLGGNMFQTEYDIYGTPQPRQMHDSGTGNNYLFYDGHVKFYKRGVIKADLNQFMAGQPDFKDNYYYIPK